MFQNFNATLSRIHSFNLQTKLYIQVNTCVCDELGRRCKNGFGRHSGGGLGRNEQVSSPLVHWSCLPRIFNRTIDSSGDFLQRHATIPVSCKLRSQFKRLP